MIKGINRQMIEVTHTGSPYFERAYLVVRAGCSQPADETLRQLADKVVQQADTYAGLRRQRIRLWRQRILWTLLSAAAGAGVTWVLLQLL